MLYCDKNRMITEALVFYKLGLQIILKLQMQVTVKYKIWVQL